MTISLNQSVKDFLLAKSFISQEDAEADGVSSAVTAAYTSYCLNQLGMPNQFVPVTVEGLPNAILDDADFTVVEVEVPDDLESAEEKSEEKSEEIAPIEATNRFEIKANSVDVSDNVKTNTEVKPAEAPKEAVTNELKEDKTKEVIVPTEDKKEVLAAAAAPAVNKFFSKK
jgi:hypothetical protein